MHDTLQGLHMLPWRWYCNALKICLLSSTSCVVITGSDLFTGGIGVN